MKVDRTLKVILLLIALGLFANALSPLIQPRIAVKAADATKTHCTGKVTVNAFGSTETLVGGWNVDINCDAE